jgi:uncharacterized protein (TIGR00725 family)
MIHAARIVSVAGSPDASEAETAFAEELGRLLAESGFTIACGGGPGVMEAVCRGAVSAGGETIGLLPSDDPADASEFVTLPIPTGLGRARNRVVALAGSALIAVGGRYGTLSEIAFALDAGRPVCAFGRWGAIPGVVPVESPQQARDFAASSHEEER